MRNHSQSLICSQNFILRICQKCCSDGMTLFSAIRFLKYCTVHSFPKLIHLVKGRSNLKRNNPKIHSQKPLRWKRADRVKGLHLKIRNHTQSLICSQKFSQNLWEMLLWRNDKFKTFQNPGKTREKNLCGKKKYFSRTVKIKTKTSTYLTNTVLQATIAVFEIKI